MGKDRELRKALGYEEGKKYTIAYTNTTRKLSDRLTQLEHKLQNQAIGEVYSNSNLKQTQVNANSWEWKITYNSDDSYWQKFSQKDIDDQVGDKIKINGKWHDKKNVVFYNDISREKRKVERRFEK